MFYQVPMLVAIVLAIMYPQSGADKVLAGMMVLFSSMFYLLMFSAMSGTKDVALDLETTRLNPLWQNRVLTIASAIALYKIGMIEVFYYILPFQLIALSSDLLATGFLLGYLEMREVDPDDDEEGDDY
jgi:hypothetical protein|tara:strand:+ start:1344 stop:1727 length:384 start_codon:yes stop_codon:yes gene_type:complete